MTWLVTADLHLDDKPQHSYRWGIFDWLAKQQKQYKTRGCLILGDLTDEKDRHSASVVNRLVDGIRSLEPPVYILKGNHDYIHHDNPFFGFLNYLDEVEFITEPKEIDVRIAAIPHQPDQKSFDNACREVFGALEGQEISMVLLHGLFDGAIGDTGTRLSGLSAALVAKMKPGLVLAGDVHRPQQVGCITYVGAPYRIRFGDNYNPRALVVDKSISNLRFPCPTKHSLVIRNADEILGKGLARGDQVKLVIDLAREEAVQWAEYKQRALDVCRELGVEVFGIKLRLPEPKPRQPLASPTRQTYQLTLEGFCQAEDVRADIRKAGMCLISSQSG